ncbi:hypothetical protein LAZ67_3002688 [Cordylochernes scorpioides]|uniref:RNA-directed DNA polymerase n=1 Tax=Cordylochernes scorpioides TaxID=51811 RepID=A0ABY6K9S3_9ARAC|nr:hypothetical protein LAZ67_3002688 [Cordylochernes scorpioides]
MNINVDRIGICEALIDTGADLSVVDLSTALNTGLEIINPDKMCSGPDGKELDIVGNIILNIKFDDKTITHQFVIMRTHLRIFILGRDFLKKMNAKIDCQREIIKYDLTENRDVIKYQQKKIKSAKDAIIPELSIKLINAFVEAEDGEYIIEENHKMFQTNGLRLARSLINVVNKETYIWITNPYPRPLKILKNQTLCFGSQPAEVNLMEESEQKEHEEPQFQINENLAYTEKEQLKQVLERYEDLFPSGLGRSNLAKHRIDTEGAKPIKHKPYRVSAKEREIIKEQIDEMLRDGIIRPSSSPWSFPVILVKKRDGKYRFCVDYRKLNDVTVKDVYPIPRIDEVLDTLQGSKYFSAIDLKSGYWQVEVEEKDKEKTAFTTAHGLYEFNVMPFGLCNAPATFERNMENMLGNLRWQICLCYLDDVIIYSLDFSTHLKRIEAVLKCFREANLKLNNKKCQFAFEELEILGHINNQHGIKPAEHNIKAIRDFPRPKKIKEIQSFLGMCSYYRKFIKGFSKIADPLTSLIKKNVPFTWTENQEKAFQTLKVALINPPILGHFDPNAITYIHTDASNIGLGATLVQKFGDKGKVISYLSRTLCKPEQNYSTTEKECLAVVWSMSKLRPYLYGRHFKIVTDHHALCWLKNLKDPTGRLARWALKIQEYNFEIIHKSGKKHLDADGLSRGPLPENEWDEDYERLFLNQIIDEKDDFIENIKENLSGNKRSITQNFKEENGCLYKKNPNPEGRAWLLVVPKKRRKEVMSEYHNHMLNGHLGVARTTYRLKNKYYWPSMLKDVSEFVKTCHLCQSRKGSKHLPSGLLQPIPPANYPFERIGIDFVGPLPSTKRRRKWIIVLTDYYTKGSHFTSNLMKEVMKMCKVKHCFTTSYHPQTNGLTERLNRTLINMISMYVNTDQKNWDEILPFITHAYNTTIQETTGYSPFFLLFGREPMSLLDDENIPTDSNMDDYDEYIENYLDKIARTRQVVINNTEKTQERMKINYDKKHNEKIYEPGHLVAVWTPVRKIGKCEKLLRKYFGPYRIIKKLSNVNYLIEPKDNPGQDPLIVHVSRLKPYFERIDEASVDNPRVPLHPQRRRVSSKGLPQASVYIGETSRDLSIRIKEHQRNISKLNPNSLIVDHVRETGHTPDFNNTRILHTNAKTKTQRLILEAIETMKHPKPLNKSIQLPSHKIWKQFIETGTIKRKEGSGRKIKTATSEDRYLVVTAKRHKEMTAIQLSNELSSATGTRISRQTFYRRLHEGAIYARRPMVCFPLTSAHRMDWPARSLDLNPIEHVWDALGRRIEARHPSPRTLVELRTALLEEWGLLPLDLLQSLVLELTFYSLQVGIVAQKVKEYESKLAAPCDDKMSQSSTSDVKRQIKLPKFELKKYTGELEEWLSWWSHFEKIHLDESLSDVDKFEYLIQSMVVGSKAHRLVTSFPLTQKNYNKVIGDLKDRFGDRDMLTELYVRKLLKLVIASARSEKRTLAQLYDDLVAHLHSLGSLGVDTKSGGGAFLYPLVESSLPLELIKIWQRSRTPYIEAGIENSGAKAFDKLEGLIEFLKQEVKNAERISFVAEGFEPSLPLKQGKRENNSPKIHTASALFVGKTNLPCLFCDKDNHLSQNCFKAAKMLESDRLKRVQDAKVCFKCLRNNHLKKDCRSFVRCKRCQGPHFEIMCRGTSHSQENLNWRSDNRSHNSLAEQNEGISEPVTAMANQVCTNNISLMTLIVKLKGPKRSKMVRVLLDSGSQKSYIRRSLAKELDLPKVGEVKLNKFLFGGQTTGEKAHSIFYFQLDNVDKGKAFKMEALEETIICGNISPVETGPRQWELDKKGITLTKVDNNKTEIDILIGGDYYGQLLTGKIEQLAGGLTAIQTVLGWTLIGNTSSERPETSAQMVITLLTTQQRVASLWELETIGIRDPTEVISVKEKNVLMQEKFREKICRGHDGRYLVSLPWKEGIGTIPNNLEIAKRRLEAMTQRLTQKGQFVPYDEVFRSWFRENLIEEVDREDIRPTGHYLPHRPIYKVQSQTTPIRPVYDASCKSSKRSLSLNDCLETGPNLIELLPEILIRFREKKIGAIADIRKAFQTIGIDEKERDYLRFLWWDEQDPSKIRTLRHTRVVFGLTCSPFILAAVLKYHLESIVDDRKSVADVLKRSFYVDNLVFSVDEPDELERIREVANDIMDEAKMTLREWEYGGSKILENKEDSRVLGLYWNKERDTLRCHIPQDTTKYGEVTKRTLLSNLQKFFDPLGFYQPIFLIPKLLMQRAWLLKLGWDQPLPTDIQQEFKKWSEELDHVKKLEFPRYARVTRSENLELHVFGDASKRAYATVAFLRSVQDGIVHISLLAAKTRVAPLKSITIPRLELLACLLSARLATSIVRALARPIKTIFWSDSSTALSWISTKHEWSIFVSNRVNEIRSSTNIDDWRFVPGTLNPADLPSRGCYAPQFILSKWWEGPQWLRESEDKWPQQKPIPNEKQVLEEKKGTVVQNTIVQNRTFWYISKFSSYKANLRVLAWVLRFIKILKREDIQDKTLSTHEVVQAEKVLIRLVQRDSLGKGQISHLKTKVQSDGLMYIETKLLYDQSPEEFRKPVLLPCDHPITEQLIRETHLNNCHAGVHFLLSKLREKFWILKARKTIKRVVRGCIICRRHAEKANTIPCAPLPKDRLFRGRPFEVTGVDLMGPLYLKNGQKIWITLFTCAVYRAVHLELVEGLDATNFIMALERFIHRRGRPVKIYSDNGTNFKRTNRLFTDLNWDKIARYSCDKQIRWIFIPPSAPWWGGWWERLVRLVKDLLRRTLGTKRVNYVQLETLICHVEAIINTRPLTYISETEDDLIPITPQMFIQNNFGSFDESHELSPDNTRQHFRKLQQIKKELKERFHKEYLAMLVQKGNETEGRRFLPGEVVLIGRDDQKRIFWPLGRILELYPGKDGRERVARVRTATGEFVRPLKRLFSLELGSDISREVRLPKTEGIKAQEIPTDGEQSIFTRSGREVKKPTRLRVYTNNLS